MAKHIILIHGRDIKPSKACYTRLGKRAIGEGLRRAGFAQLAEDLDAGRINYSAVYYGDINNKILAERSVRVRRLLTAHDADYNDAPCFDADGLQQSFEWTERIQRFNKKAYDKVLSEAQDRRVMDELADIAGFIGALFTGGLLNNQLIRHATADLFAYLSSHQIGSTVRQRLNEVLYPALMNGDEVCLLAHSMGCIVSYDLMWKYAHTSEYADLKAKKKPVSLWLTFGNPLGEVGVRQNLLDGRFHKKEDKYPLGQVLDWLNIYAEDDFIAHIERMAPIYRKLKPKALRNVSDAKIYNCWTYEDTESGKTISNPHDMYGYLMNENLAKYLGQWLS